LNSAAIDKSCKAAQPLSTPRKKSESAVPRVSPFMKTQLPLAELSASVQPSVFASWFAPQWTFGQSPVQMTLILHLKADLTKDKAVPESMSTSGDTRSTASSGTRTPSRAAQENQKRAPPARRQESLLQCPDVLVQLSRVGKARKDIQQSRCSKMRRLEVILRHFDNHTEAEVVYTG
jgi:hypothetical protein